MQSVLPIIDTYLICDTGSTDNTPQIITDFFTQHGIQGEVIYEPFKNFGYNRTYALQKARDRATYALLLDADMIFKIEPEFDKQSLTADSYLIIQRGGSLSYHNTRLIRLDIDAKCVGPTHEYYDLPAGSRSEKLDSIWIADIGDGGAKADKFERDIRLLKEGILEEPANGRYYFYLANSYFNTGRHEESIPYYRKRIELGGWHEEVFYAHLNLGHAYMTIGQPELAVYTWMNGYNLHPTRAETIYEITKHYRIIGKQKIGMAFALLGKQIPYPKNDTLFIHNDVYDTGFDYEMSVLGYYTGLPNLHKLVHKLMNKMPYRWDNLLSNYKFCYPKLLQFLKTKVGGITVKDEIHICGSRYQMAGSNPCIFRMGNQYMMNIRMVNYHINHNGSYYFPVDDGKIITVNKICTLDDNFNYKNLTAPCGGINYPPRFLIPEDRSMRYVGIEDWKPFPYSTMGAYKWPFLGTIQSPITGNIAIGYGVYDWETSSSSLEYGEVVTPWNKECEKNWVFCNAECDVIYKWFPLTIGKIVEEPTNEPTNEPNDKLIHKNTKKQYMLEVKKEIPMPDFFRQVRGSTHGYEYDLEVWFLCHVVEYSQPREYYHFFVVFDKDIFTGELKLNRWSNLFKFEGEKIEYALGLIVEQDRLIVSYSKWDREPVIGVYDKFKLEMEMF